jgi:MbtH protein
VEAAMSTDAREDTTIYKVVVNHEDQYSIWPANRENALGWTDMRPLSLRRTMEESGQ